MEDELSDELGPTPGERASAKDQPQLDNLVADPLSAAEFLQLFGDDVILCTQIPGSGGMSGLRGSNALNEALRRNALGCNVYYAPNAVKPAVVKKPAKSDILSIRAIYGDIDWNRVRHLGRFDEGLAELETTQCELETQAKPPSFIVHTGGGLQPIWLIQLMQNCPENLRRAEAASKYVEDRFRGDPVGNIDRILRLPGSINHPNQSKRDSGQERRLAEIVYRSGRVYQLEELEYAWGLDGETEAATSFISLDRETTQVKVLTTSRGLTLPTTSLPSASGSQYNSDEFDDLVAGIPEYELDLCRQYGWIIANHLNGPFSSRKPWRDPTTGELTDFSWEVWLFVMRGMADDYPWLEGECKALYDDVNNFAGGDTSQNDKQWIATKGRMATRCTAGRSVVTLGTLAEIANHIPDQEQSAPYAADDFGQAPGASEAEPARVRSSEQASALEQSTAGLSGANTDVHRSFSMLGDIDENPVPRPWALPPLALYGEVTTIASPGGFGKTALGVGLALEAASARNFLGHKVFQGPQTVLLVSSEESESELSRRFKAAIRHHQITQAASDRVTIRGTDTEDGSRIELLTMERQTAKLNSGGLRRLEWLLYDTGARIVILDPLNNFLAGGLNDNAAMGALLGELKSIAIKRSAAIILLHHTSKGADLETTDAVMGASAIANFSRVAITLVRMQADEARRHYPNVPPSQVRHYFRLNYGKTNYALTPEDDQWFRQCSVDLGNDTPEYPKGDSVGVVERVDPMATHLGTFDPTHIRIALRTIRSAPTNGLLGLRKRGGTKRYANDHIGQALRQSGARIRPRDLEERVDRLIDELFARQLILEDEFKDLHRKRQRGLKLTEAGIKLLDETVQ